MDGRADFHIGLARVLLDRLRLLADVDKLRLLLLDHDAEVGKQLHQLAQCLLNLLHVLLARPDGVERRRRLSHAVALHEGLLEDLGVAAGVLDGGADLGLGRVGSDDPVLARHLILRLLSERRLDLLVFLVGLLQAALDAPDLRRISGLPSLGDRLDHAHALRQIAEHGHCARREVVELSPCRCSVCLDQGPVLQHPERVEVPLDAIYRAVDVSALVEDGVGVVPVEGARALGQLRHLDVACCLGAFGQSLIGTMGKLPRGHESGNLHP